MNYEDNLKKLKDFSIFTKEDFFSSAFSRNIGLLSPDEQKRVSSFRIAVPGMGGVGGLHLMSLVRTGFTKFNLADFDVFEPVNINRQYGAKPETFGKSKINVMKNEAFSVNPYLEINLFEKGLNESNLDEFLEGADIVIDSLDFFQFDIRRALFKRAAEKGLYVITAGPIGFSSAMLVFSPYGMKFDEYFNITDKTPENEKYISFAMGLSPKATHVKYMDMKKVDFDSKAGPSLNLACLLCAGIATAEALKILLKRGSVKPVPYYFQFDPYLQVFKKGKLNFGNKNPSQKIKKRIFQYLITRNKQIFKPEIPKIPDKVLDENNNITNDTFSFLIMHALQAPSGDNCQPWIYEFKNGIINLSLNESTDKSFFNYNQFASKIACGAFLENLKIAANSIELDTDINYSTQEKQAGSICSVSFKQNSGLSESVKSLTDSIWKRTTNRKLFDKKPVSKELIKSIKNEINDFPGAGIEFIMDSKKLKKIAKLVFDADIIRSENRSLHEHLISMIRFSDEEALSNKDGFHIKNLEAGLAGELFLKMNKSWSVMNVSNKLGFAKVVAMASYKGIVNSSGVGLITVGGNDDEDFIKGGQALERCWLKLTSLGLSMQPMTAITLFLLRLRMSGSGDFYKKHINLINNVYYRYNDLFGSNFDQERYPVMLFRFGYADPIKYNTLRKF